MKVYTVQTDNGLIDIYSSKALAFEKATQLLYEICELEHTKFEDVCFQLARPDGWTYTPDEGESFVEVRKWEVKDTVDLFDKFFLGNYIELDHPSGCGLLPEGKWERI